MKKPAGAAKCVNFGGCSKADSRETVEVGVGEDMLCPECGRPLSGGGKAKGASGASLFKGPVLVIGLGVALLGGITAFLMWPEAQPEPQPTPAPIPAPVPDPGPPPQPQPQPQPDPNVPVPVPAPGPELQPQPQPQPVQPEPLPPQPQPKPQPRPPQPQPVPAPQPEPTPSPAPYKGPTAGTIVWEGSIAGTELITIQRGSPSSGTIVSGSLPGVAVILQPTDEKHVTIAAAPQPADQFQRVVFRVKNKGRTRVTLRWAVP